MDFCVKFSDLDSYVALLGDPQSWTKIQTDPIDADRFCEACKDRLASRANRFPPLRCITVRRFFSRIQDTCLTRPVKVKLHPFQRGYGYMLDRGEIHILSDLLFRSTQGKFIAVLLHETAHLVLSQGASYHRLLQLDLAFAETYLKDRHDECLKAITPVEFFAQQIANRWMEALVARLPQGKLRSCLHRELAMMDKKLSSAIETLNKTYTNTQI